LERKFWKTWTTFGICSYCQYSGETEQDIRARLAKVREAELNNIWRNYLIFKPNVIVVFLYGLKTWRMFKADETQEENF